MNTESTRHIIHKICTKCGADHTTKWKRCPDCKSKAADKYLKRLESGLCVSCPAEALTGKVRCFNCSEKAKQEFRIKTEKGICVTCSGTAEEGYVRCAACHSNNIVAYKDYYKRTRAARSAQSSEAANAA